MSKYQLLSLGIVLAVMAAPALADEVSSDHGWSKPGFYVFLGGTSAIDMAAEDILKATSGMDVDYSNSIGAKFKAGNRIAKHLAVEVELEYLAGFTTEIMGIQAVDTTGFSSTVNIKPYLLSGRIQPFALLGGGFMYASIEDKVGLGMTASGVGAALRMGGGVDVYVTENIAVTTDITYVLPIGQVANLDYLSIGWGLQYKF